MQLLTVGVIEPNALLRDGRYATCDGCPDMTYHEWRLVHSCRLDEYRLDGGLAKPVIPGRARRISPRRSSEAGL
jgi:hypothetical protein